MELKDYIINDVKPLVPSTTIGDVQDIFKQLTYSHLPVMDASTYLGCIAETDAHCLDSSKRLEDVRYTLTPFFVTVTTHWLDVLEACARHQTNVMPVMDIEQNYLGYYELKDVLELFNDAPFLYEAGSVIVVEKGTTDYSFTEVAQIVESNDARLYGCFISNTRDHMTELTVKASSDNIAGLLQTFRRYSYEILNASEDDTYMDVLKERSDYLDRYLNI